jgi:hypothetical protein
MTRNKGKQPMNAIYSVLSELLSDYGSSFLKENLDSAYKEIDIRTNSSGINFSKEKAEFLRQCFRKIWKSQIEQEIKEREIKTLVHFTRLENLPSILKNGLVPRTKLENEKVPFLYSDEQRIDHNRDGICLSITTPNTKMLSAKMRNKSYEFVLLLFNASELLLNDDFTRLPKFYYTNCASTEILGNRRINEIESYSSVGAFKFMFKEKFDVQLSYDGDPNRERTNHSKNETTDIQAEVVICETIPPSYIKDIVFLDYKGQSDESDMDIFCQGLIEKNIFNIKPMVYFYSKQNGVINIDVNAKLAQMKRDVEISQSSTPNGLTSKLAQHFKDR